MARFAEDAPYKLSRAALRQQYGARAITSGGQSSRDYTPSGRQAYLEQESARTGRTPAQVAAPDATAILSKEQVDQEFRNQFKPQLGNPSISLTGKQQPYVGPDIATPQVIQTPYKTVTLGLLPEMADADPLGMESPNPLNNFSLPKFKTTFLGQPLNKRYG